MTAQATVFWNIGGEVLFDTSLSYSIHGPYRTGRVTVDLDAPDPRCPLGLGRWFPDRRPVGEIELVFGTDQEGEGWLHVAWNAQLLDKDQFEVFCNGASAGRSKAVDAQQDPDLWTVDRFKVRIKKGGNTILLRYLTADSDDGLRFKNIVLCALEDHSYLPSPLCPTAPIRTLSEYEKVSKKQGVMLDEKHVRLYAPKKLAREASTLFPYLVRAYDELFSLVGVHTKYKIIVYTFPPECPYSYGGTDTETCTILYTYGLLDLASHTEWQQHGVPHISGVIEEMAHNFIHGFEVRFGMEALGACTSGLVLEKVADTAYYQRRKEAAIKTFADTARRYIENGYVLPADIPPAGVDQIYAHILWKCREKYGPGLWRDFWAEARKEKDRLRAAVRLKDFYDILDERYRITIGAFDQLPGLEFKKMLQDLRVSLRSSGYTITRAGPDWDRRYIPPQERELVEGSAPGSLLEWTPCGHNPILAPGPVGSWDEHIRERMWVIYEEGKYHGWYCGWQGKYDKEKPNLLKLGYATSSDGIHWTKHPNNPVFTERWVEDICVVKSGNTYYMYSEDEGASDTVIHLLKSTDKVSWQEHGNVLERQEGNYWEDRAVGTPLAWKEGEQWFLLYEGLRNRTAENSQWPYGDVGLAFSTDGSHWTRSEKNPVFPAWGNGWDKTVTAPDSIIKLDGTYYLFYHARGNSPHYLSGIASSTDLLRWEKYLGNPVFLPDVSPVVVDVGDQYLMYTWMHNRGINLYSSLKKLHW